MLRITSVLVVCLALSQPCWARQQDRQITVDDLSAPTSPAFVLLGISPAAVERPDNARSFVLNALNKLASSDTGFPKDIALQITPYWMKSHPNLDFRTYQEPGIAQSILQSFSVSIGTSPIAAPTKGAD